MALVTCNSFDAGVFAVVLLVLSTVSGTEREDFRCQNGSEKMPKARKMDTKVCRRPRDVPKTTLVNRVEKVRKMVVPSLALGCPFKYKSIKNRCQKSSKKRLWNNIEFDAKVVTKWT